MWVSGEDHDDAVAHAATGLVSKPDKEKKRGGMKGEKSGAGCAPRNQGEKKKGGREGERGEGGGKMEKRGASHHLCPRVLQPCHHAMLLREEWRGVVVVCIHVHVNAWQCHARHLMPSPSS